MESEEIMNRKLIISAVIVASFMTASPTSAQEGQPLAKIRMGEDGQIQVLDVTKKGENGLDSETGKTMNLTDPSNKSIKSVTVSQSIHPDSLKSRPSESLEMMPNLTFNNYWYSLAYPTLTINVRIINNGTFTAGPSYIGFYLSKDVFLSESSSKLGNKYVSSLPPGSQTEVTLNANVISYPGTWQYIIFIIDEENDVVEQWEIDNYWYITTMIEIPYPNLKTDTGHCSYSYSFPDLTINTRIMNDAWSTAAPSIVGYYLSPDPDITPSDVRLGELALESLTPGAYSDLTKTVSVRNHPGTWYVGFIIDDADRVIENNESDNTFNFPEQISIEAPNLTFDSAHCSYSFTYPDLTIHVRTINNGELTAGATTIEYSLISMINPFISWDTQFHEQNISSIPPGSSIDQTITVDVSAYPGTWYLGFIVDIHQNVPEHDEHDNHLVFPDQIVVGPSLPTQCDLIVASVQINDHEGPDIIYNLTVENQGTEATQASFKNIIYLSGDKTITSADYRINDWNVTESLAPGESKTSWDLTSAVSGVPAGEYYLGVIADWNNDILESDENNNTFCVDSPTIRIENQSSESTIVTHTGDTGDGSLRNAMDQANQSPNPDSILFNIPLSDPGFDAEKGVWTIKPVSPLPIMTDSLVVIDGYSQALFAGDLNPYGPEIQLDGSEVAGSPSHGLFILSGMNTIRGLIINRFHDSGILLSGPGANGNLLVDNYIGVNSRADDVLPNSQYGVYIAEGARNAIGLLPSEAGSQTAAAMKKQRTDGTIGNKQQGPMGFGNIIAGNVAGGIRISGEVATENRILSNFIQSNFNHGILLSGSVRNTQIFLNTISYNQGAGVMIEGENAIQNTLLTNSITANGLEGIALEGGNIMLPAPVIQTVTDTSITGLSLPNARVQFCSDPEDEGELVFGEAFSDASGNFSWTGIVLGTRITATATDALGNTSAFSAPFETGTEVASSEPLPNRFALYQNTPNPFNPSTTIRFQIPEPCFVSLKVYDLLGKEVATLVHEYKTPGLYAAEWNANNLSSGIYICHMNAGAFTGITKLVLQK
jgi:hypothetical protein